MISEEDRERYDTDQIDFTPNPELGELAQELLAVIEELHDDHRSDSNR